jgi:predicted Zn-dependent peptidase
MNGTTNSDRTNYYELLPQNELELALWLEADRMKSLDISEKNFENQRAVVKEEYRMRLENAAYAPAGIRTDELTFQNYWPYSHSTIGSMADLDGAKLEWVRAFHDSYYGPNNAVLSITGDFDPTQAMAWVTKWFGDAKPIVNLPAPPATPAVLDPLPTREDNVTDAHAKLPAIFLAWAIPRSREADHYALEVAGSLLGDGESSRLYKRLVRERALCVETSAGTDGRRGPDEFSVVAKLTGGAKVEQVQAILDAEIAGLARNGPKPAELDKVKNRIAAGRVLGLQSNFARAHELAEYELYWGDASLVNGELDRYLAVTADDVKRVMTKYLQKANRARVVVTPGEKSDKDKPAAAATTTKAPAPTKMTAKAPAAAKAPTTTKGGKP